MTTESSRLLRAGFLLTAALLFSAATAAPRGNAPKKPLAPKAEGITRLVTYNVGVFNKYIADDYPLITAMMQEIDADAVCMNELDSCTNRTGRVFQLGHIAELLGGWDVNYGAAMTFDGGKYGVGIVSREKALRTFSVVLEKGAGAEPRALVVSEFERFVLATAHLDHVSAEQQAIQAATINRIMQGTLRKIDEAPVFLGGDMNATPDSETLRILAPRLEGTDTRRSHLSVQRSAQVHRLHLPTRQRRQVRDRAGPGPRPLRGGRREEGVGSPARGAGHPPRRGVTGGRRSRTSASEKRRPATPEGCRRPHGRDTLLRAGRCSPQHGRVPRRKMLPAHGRVTIRRTAPPDE